MKFAKSKKLQKLSHQLIPGGAMTYSKGDDQFPQLAPGFITKGQGAYIWDVDGNKFLDWQMGVRSTILGYGYQPVIQAVKAKLDAGTNFSRPTVLEIDLAKKLQRLIPGAEMVKFNKNGSATTSAAVKLARAYTKRDLVAMPEGSYNGSDDWGIAITPANGGIPKAVLKMTVTFIYNDIKSVEQMFKKYKNKIACVILEPVMEHEPKDNFLKKLQVLCRRHGTVLVFDEMISGFRVDLRGAQHKYQVTPDLSTFGKAMANGFSLAALVGKRKLMKLGGIHGNNERVFLLSSTHGAETHALAAASKTIDEIQRTKVISHMDKVGKKLKKVLNEITRQHELEDVLEVFGDLGCRTACRFHDVGLYSAMVIKTYFYQEMISQGVLFNGYFSPSLAHGQKEFALTARAWDYACHKLKRALEQGNLNKQLVGPPVKPTFRKLN